MSAPWQKLTLALIVVQGLSGCAQNWFDSPKDTVNTADSGTQDNFAAQSLHYYVEQLARQLLSTAGNIDINKSIAVGTILPADLKSGNKLPAMTEFGLQVQESLITLTTQAGLKVIEYKTMPNIKLGENYDAMLSRQLATLNDHVMADYFLTGTYTVMEKDTLVNLRLIQLPSHTVIAAATDYVPANAMWSKTRVTMKDNQIYRGSY